MKSLCFILFLVPFLITETVVGDATAPEAWEGVFSDTFVSPAEELPVHIAGGFFSVFDRRQGHTREERGDRPELTGSIRLRLEGLEHQGPWVYLPSGKIELKPPGQRKITLEMQRLDYYLHTPTGELMFRLTGCSGGGKWCILCRVGSFGTPTLEGFVFRKGPFGFCRRICGFTIRGRSGNEAETHLQKVVTPATRVCGVTGR